jgi:hypothetical protein
MKVDDVKFWLIVKEEVGEAKDFLCFSSDTFKSFWRYNKYDDTIRRLAKKFLKDTKQKKVFSVSYGLSLFDSPTGNISGDTWTREEFYQLRTDFVDYCVNKFSK